MHLSDSFVALLRILALAYGGLCLFVFLRQPAYVYYPGRDVMLTPSAAGLSHEEVTLATADGEALGAWYVPAARGGPPARTLLVFHGNAGNIGDRVDAVRAFHELGFNVLIFDYRGFGRSTGRPTEKGTYQDALAAWGYLTRERGEPPQNVILFGRSLGGAVAAWLAEQVRPGGLVLEGTMTSAPDMAVTMFPYLPVRWLCRFRYDALARMGRIRCSVLIAHSRADEIIPFRHGRRLFEAAREPKQFVELHQDHNATEVELEPHYRRALQEFARSLPPAS
jgi:alpha-beta hydrolase superfamily lysophospholipase